MSAQNQTINQFIEQLNSLVQSYQELGRTARYDDLSDLGPQIAQNFTTRAVAAVERVAGRQSVYFNQVQTILARNDQNDFSRLELLIGLLESLSEDLQAGYLNSLPQLIHGELFGDFLEMSEHLLDEGYKDPAAVIAGASLESHLKQLSTGHGIETQQDSTTGLRPKRADLLNSELAAAGAISKLDQKSVTAWLDLRNKAAHGQYSEYGKEQVALMIAGVRDFIFRTPA